MLTGSWFAFWKLGWGRAPLENVKGALNAGWAEKVCFAGLVSGGRVRKAYGGGG